MLVAGSVAVGASALGGGDAGAAGARAGGTSSASMPEARERRRLWELEGAAIRCRYCSSRFASGVKIWGNMVIIIIVIITIIIITIIIIIIMAIIIIKELARIANPHYFCS